MSKCNEKIKGFAVCSLDKNHEEAHKDPLTGISWMEYSPPRLEEKETPANHLFDVLDVLADEFIKVAKSKGFYSSPEYEPAKDIAKCHEEISELWQAISKRQFHQPSEKAEDMKEKIGTIMTSGQEEIADIIIQALKVGKIIANAYGLEKISDLVRLKNSYNKTRKWLHGDDKNEK